MNVLGPQDFVKHVCGTVCQPLRTTVETFNRCVLNVVSLTPLIELYANESTVKGRWHFPVISPNA